MDESLAKDKVLGAVMRYSDEHAQYASMAAGLPVDAERKPLLNYTYPAADYLRQFNLQACEVFGYACGFSSLWWAMRCKSVITIEMDLQMHRFLGRQKRENLVTISIDPDDKRSFVASLEDSEYAPGVLCIGPVTGGDCAQRIRDLCLRKQIAPSFIVIENARTSRDTRVALAGLTEYIAVDFYGLAPVSEESSVTSILLRRDVKF